MKPLKLTMTAFGPYKDKEEIDFTQLHEHGIFVVSGSTGAGKTTIFDAITFALYDTGSGEDREKSLFLRSDFADATVDTEVELTFEVRGQIYRIWRKFGVDGANAKREFYEVTNGQEVPAVEKFQVKIVQSKVEELIGLTQAQFNQIVMLPQGEFQKLLTSESKHKEEIFRKIFKTERFTKMVELLRDKKKLAEKMFDQAKMQQEHSIYEIKSRLPERESELFLIINSELINMYQVEQALQTEQQHYEEQAVLLHEQYDVLKSDYKKQNEAYSEQKLLNERIAKFLERQTRLVELKEQEQVFQQQEASLELAQKASQIEPLEREFEKAKTQLATARNAFEKATTEHNQAQQYLQIAEQTYTTQCENEPMLAMYTKNISQLEQLVPVYQTIDAQRLTVEKLMTDQKNAEQLFEKLTVEEQVLKEKHKSQKSIVKQLEEAVSQYQYVYEQHADISRKVELANETGQLENHVATLEQQAEMKQTLAKEAKLQLKQVEQQIRSNQAAFIASTLYEGEACPVCGSLDHPAVHNQKTLEVEDHVVEDLRKKTDVAMQQYYQANSKLETSIATLQLKQSQLQELQIAVDDCAQYEQQKVALAQQLLVLKEQQQRLTTEKQALEQLVQQVDILQGRINKGREFVADLTTQLAQEKGKLEQIEKLLMPQFATVHQVAEALKQQQAQFNELKQALQQATEKLQQARLGEKTCAVNLDHAMNRFTEQQQEEAVSQTTFHEALTNGYFDFESYKRSILPVEKQQQIRQAIEQFKQTLHTITVQIEEDTPYLDGKKLVDLAAREQQIAALNEQVEKHFAYYKLAESYVKQCQVTTEKLQEVSEQIEDYKAKLFQIEHVYDLIRGQNESKISFERFAQIGYLEKVTHAANERLKVLSNGQYFLKSTGRKEGNAQSGLSIDVFDSNTGQTRDVKTLSGGEKFNASLALALGMADVIQSVQGSVHIDTMFIDEGFGTLDEEALRRAIDILIDLQQTGRLIGVISHVAELKAAMPAILQVHKLKEGHSKTEIIIK